MLSYKITKKHLRVTYKILCIYVSDWVERSRVKQRLVYRVSTPANRFLSNLSVMEYPRCTNKLWSRLTQPAIRSAHWAEGEPRVRLTCPYCDRVQKGYSPSILTLEPPVFWVCVPCLRRFKVV